VRLVRIGKITRAVGLRGHVGIAGTEDSLAGLGRVVLRRGSAEESAPRKVVEARRQGRLWVVRFEGAGRREDAEAMVGCEVLAVREDLGEAGQGRYYWADLEGMLVVTVTGETLGTVTGHYETGGVDVLIVTREGSEALVPLAPYVTVDCAARKVVVDPPEGLLEQEAQGREEKGGPGRGD
jgi:16S rRNA processing protein RimM